MRGGWSLLAMAILAATVLAGCAAAPDPEGAEPSTTASAPRPIIVNNLWVNRTDGAAAKTLTVTQTVTASPSSSGSNSSSSSSSSSSNSSTTGSSTSTSTGPPPNRAPVILFLSANPAKTDLGKDVTFHVDAYDPDNDRISFRLTLGENGVDAVNGTFPHDDIVHRYSTAGNHSVTLSVDDSHNHTTVRTIYVDVRVPFAPLHFDGTVAQNCAQCRAASTACQGFQAGTQGQDCVWFELPANATGHPFRVQGQTDVGAWFRGSCAKAGSDLKNADAPTGSQANVESGTVPSGARCILVYESVVSAAAVHLTVDIAA